MGIRSEKRVVRRLRCCANITECTYTNLDSIAYYTPMLYGIAYCCQQWRTQEFFSGGVQQIQLRTEDREDGDLGVVVP